MGFVLYVFLDPALSAVQHVTCLWNDSVAVLLWSCHVVLLDEARTTMSLSTCVRISYTANVACIKFLM